MYVIITHAIEFSFFYSIVALFLKFHFPCSCVSDFINMVNLDPAILLIVMKSFRRPDESKKSDVSCGMSDVGFPQPYCRIFSN